MSNKTQDAVYNAKELGVGKVTVLVGCGVFSVDEEGIVTVARETAYYLFVF